MLSAVVSVGRSPGDGQGQLQRSGVQAGKTGVGIHQCWGWGGAWQGWLWGPLTRLQSQNNKQEGRFGRGLRGNWPRRAWLAKIPCSML